MGNESCLALQPPSGIGSAATKPIAMKTLEKAACMGPLTMDEWTFTFPQACEKFEEWTALCPRKSSSTGTAPCHVN